MPQRVLESRVIVTSTDGRAYAPVIVGEARENGTWEGWIEFEPVHGGSAVSTTRETTQPNLGALEYWAGGLEPVYFEGALTRATHRRSP